MAFISACTERPYSSIPLNRDLRDTHYLYAGGSSDMFETNLAGTTSYSTTDGPTGDLAHYTGPPTSGSTVSYQYLNGHGDLAAEADNTGTRTNIYSYDPFGGPNETTPTNTTTKRWTGGYDKRLDTASNLIQMGARPYDPVLGRFVTTDPIEGGSLNAYDYSGQDPVNSFDLTGLMVSEEPSNVGAIFGGVGDEGGGVGPDGVPHPNERGPSYGESVDVGGWRLDGDVFEGHILEGHGPESAGRGSKFNEETNIIDSIHDTVTHPDGDGEGIFPGVPCLGLHAC